MAYGIGTRSDNRYPEHNAMKRERKAFTKRYEAGEIKFEPMVILLCHCRSFRYSHPPSDHKKLLSDMDWRTWEERSHSEIWEERIR
jgi:hypothetical protein